MATLTPTLGRAGSIDATLVTRPRTAGIGAATPLGQALRRLASSSAPHEGGFNSYVGSGFNSYIGTGFPDSGTR